MTEKMNPALMGATTLIPQGPGYIAAFSYSGVADEIKAYQTSAWIGTSLMASPVYDVYGRKIANSVREIAGKKLPRGIYVVNGAKFNVK